MSAVELIYDADCPNVAAARAQLIRAFARTGVPACWTEWDRGSAASPEHARRYGSPTVLVDGRDAAGEAPRTDIACCRLYRDGGGAMRGVPPVGVIAAALASAGAPRRVGQAASTRRGWAGVLATVPGIALACLPKLACPACWPAYAGVLSALGLGFLVDTRYLLPMTAAFLVLAVGALAFRARRRRGYRPFWVGTVAAAAVLIGKFAFDSDLAMYGGIGLLVGASVWNAWPRRTEPACPACAEDAPSEPTHRKAVSS